MLENYISISMFLFVAMGASLFFLLPMLFIQHLLYKKILDPTYFNDKYYSPYELGIFDSFPLFFIKTLGYVKAIIFPGSMRRKFKKDILNPKEHPFIYLLALITILIIIFHVIVLVNLGISAIFYYANY